MFIEDNLTPANLADVLKNCRTHQVCAYRSPNGPCDCKYGMGVHEKPYATSEQNGCPELRMIELVLRHMTDAEYKTILDRTEYITR